MSVPKDLTPKDLYLEERRQEIIRRVDQAGRASVAELSQQLGVSEVTIRADLQVLAAQKLIIRTHGGAIPAGGGRYELALAMRLGQQVAEKSRIGEICATLVLDGDAIFLDSSSTALAMAPYLKKHRHLTVITNGLTAARKIREIPQVRVVIPGGTLQRETDSLIGVDGLQMLQKFNIQKGFFGAHGINLPEGLTDVSADEAEIKRILATMCRQTIAMLDATKWGRVGVASFAPPEEVDIIVTDRDAPPALVKQVSAVGIEVILG